MRTLYETFLESADQIHHELIQFRRHLRRNPELSWHEHATSAYIQEQLTKHHIPYRDGYAVHGIAVDLGVDLVTPKVAWRADIDALPIQDSIQTSYASLNTGIAHACGHDVHTTIAYGIARVLSLHQDLLKRSIRVFWQPAEETLPSGAPAMIDSGILEQVEAVLALHVDPTRKVGTYGIRAGAETAAVDTFTITVEAVATAHSARPYTGKDTIWILNQVLNYLYSFGERTTDVRHPSVLSVCQISGGFAANVIPKSVHCTGTIRTTTESLRTYYYDSIQAYLDLMAKAHGVKIYLEWKPGSPAVVNDAHLAAYAQQMITDLLGSQALDQGEPSLGAEDFAYYQQKVPGLFMRVGSQSGPETAYPLHSSHFDIDEEIIVPTVAMAATLLAQYH
jgi:amidohydrolase